MRKLLLIFAILSTPCMASVTFVQGVVSSSALGTVSIATGSSITSGNLLVVSSKTGSTVAATPTFTSSSGVSCTWHVIATSAQISSFFTSSMAYCNIPSSGAETVSVSWAGGLSTFTDISVAEYSSSSGWVATSLDVTANNLSATTVTTCSTGTTATTTVANELVVAACDTFGSAQTWSGTVGAYTNRTTSSRNTKGWFDSAVISTGTQTFSTTIASDVFFGVIATFKQTTGGAVATRGKAVIF